MRTVGYIDLEIYRCIAECITTDEVIITEERIAHIKERHPGHLEILESYMKNALAEPDYILEDNKPNTGLILKLIEESDLRIQVVLRVHTVNDVDGYKNSVISAWEISENRWTNYVNNKKILYRREYNCYNLDKI